MKAIEWEGDVYWPVRVAYREARDEYQVVAVEIADVPPPTDLLVFAGDVNEEGTGTTGGTSTGGGTTDIIDGSVSTTKIADQAVTTAKIADAAVTAPKVADGAAVRSFEGRTGDVTLQKGDVDTALSNGSDSDTTTLTGTLQASGDVVAFGNGSASDPGSGLLVRDDGNAVTGSASALDFQGGVVSSDGDEVVIDLSGTGGTSDYTDSDAVAAINADTDHGSTAQHDYFSGDHADLTGLSPDDHHTRYTDSEARSAINNSSPTVATVELSNEEYSDHTSANGGELVYDASTGVGIYYGSSGSGVSKGQATILDTNNTSTGPNIALTGGASDSSVPSLSITQGSGSGLDADTLDDYEGADLAALAEDEVVTGLYAFRASTNGQGDPMVTFEGGDTKKRVVMYDEDTGANLGPRLHGSAGNPTVLSGNGAVKIVTDWDGSRVNAVYADESGKTGFGGKTDPAHEVDVAGRTRSTEVEATDTLQVGGWTLQEDSNGDLIATSPSGNEVRLGDDGDVEAFNNA
jgi:hypothetical protein